MQKQDLKKCKIAYRGVECKIMGLKLPLKTVIVMSVLVFGFYGCQHLKECEKDTSSVSLNKPEEECVPSSLLYRVFMNEEEEHVEGSSEIENTVENNSTPPEGIDFTKEIPHIWPIKDGSGHISSWFGSVRSRGGSGSRVHKGIDIIVPTGTPVVATADGVVRLACTMHGYGLLIVVEHADGINSAYAHLSKICVKEGDEVKEGDVIGLSGATGRVTTAHLHYEIRKEDTAINPVWFLPAVDE